MDEQTVASLGEKVTAASLPTRPFPITDVVDDLPLAIPVSSRRRQQRSGFFQAISAYLTALLIALPVLPIIAAIVTIGIYLPNLFSSAWLSIVYGPLFAFIAWMLVSLLIIPLTSPGNANSRSYSVVESRLQQLETRLFTIRNTYPDEKVLPEYQQVALNEAFDKLTEITEDLYESNMRLPWVTGIGYLNVWSKLHRAEEALIEVEPVEMAIRGAMHDKMALTDSQISNRDELLDKLHYSVKKLDPTIAILFRPSTATVMSDMSESPEMQELQKNVHLLQDDVRQVAYDLRLDLKAGHITDQKTQASNDTQTSARASETPIDSEGSARGRLTLREVRRAINDYRDSLWEGLIRVRNNLWRTIFITGLITCILLCIAILSTSQANGHAAIIAIAEFYMVGAVGGLFGAIRRESMTDTHIDDYGLTFVRLILTPLLSGLAGVGGVLIVSLLWAMFFSRQTANSLESILQLNLPVYLVVSAFLGFLSHLVSGNLQIQAKRYISALSKAKMTNGEMNQPDLYSVADRQLQQIFDHDLKQARQWSAISVVSAIAGLLLILGGVVTVLAWNILVGFVIALAGGVMESVAAFVLQKVKMANSLLDNSSESIRRAEKTNEEPLAEVLEQ